MKKTVSNQVKTRLKALGIKAKVKTTQSTYKIYCTISTTDIAPNKVKLIAELVESMTSNKEDIYLLHDNTQTTELRNKAVDFFISQNINEKNSAEKLREIAQPHLNKIINGTHRLSDEFWK